jgi:hypothetical protein
MGRPRRKGAKVRTTSKVNLTLDAQVAKRLRMQSAYEDKTASQIVTECLDTRLKRWRLDADVEPAGGPVQAGEARG